MREPDMTLTMYERYGGFPAVRKVVSEFYERVLESELLAHHFEEIDMRRLIDHQTRFVSYVMGGPASFSDDHLRRAHERRGITLREFEEIIALMRETLEDYDFAAEDVAAVDRELRRRESLIVSAR